MCITRLIDGGFVILDKIEQNILILLEHVDLDHVLLILWKSKSPVPVEFPIDLRHHGLSDSARSMTRVKINSLMIGTLDFFLISMEVS